MREAVVAIPVDLQCTEVLSKAIARYPSDTLSIHINEDVNDKIRAFGVGRPPGDAVRIDSPNVTFQHFESMSLIWLFLVGLSRS